MRSRPDVRVRGDGTYSRVMVTQGPVPPINPSPGGWTSTGRCTTSTTAVPLTAPCSCASTGWVARRSTGQRWPPSWPRAVASWHSTWRGSATPAAGRAPRRCRPTSGCCTASSPRSRGCRRSSSGTRWAASSRSCRRRSVPDTVAGLVLVDPALPPALNARARPARVRDVRRVPRARGRAAGAQPPSRCAVGRGGRARAAAPVLRGHVARAQRRRRPPRRAGRASAASTPTSTPRCSPPRSP